MPVCPFPRRYPTHRTVSASVVCGWIHFYTHPWKSHPRSRFRPWLLSAWSSGQWHPPLWGAFGNAELSSIYPVGQNLPSIEQDPMGFMSGSSGNRCMLGGGGGFRHHPPTPGTVSSMSNKLMRLKLLVSYRHKYSYQHHIDMNMNGLPVPFHRGENQTLDRFHDLPKSATKWGSAAGNPD